MKTEQIDRNFAVQSEIDRPDVQFFNCRQEPFSVHGLLYENGRFRRMPEEVAGSVNDGVAFLHANTAGGRVRFATDSPCIAIRARMDNIGKMPHFPLTGSAGFDLYTGERYLHTFVPPWDLQSGYESVCDLHEDLRDGGMHEFTVHFPLYSDVCELYIGVKKDSVIRPAAPYRLPHPVVYYGSSITQGGCASRPGNAYENIVSSVLNVDHVNLGFSGSARAEKTITDYICSLPMSVFVYDYDHNAPSVEHLKNTHEPLFKAVRAKYPCLPVVMMTRPQPYLNADEKERLRIVKQTYETAVANGDQNVYFIAGDTMLPPPFMNSALVDNCHPNDCGFVGMAQAVIGVMKKILGAEC